jgi:hypothetical protein
MVLDPAGQLTGFLQFINRSYKSEVGLTPFLWLY